MSGGHAPHPVGAAKLVQERQRSHGMAISPDEELDGSLPISCSELPEFPTHGILESRLRAKPIIFLALGIRQSLGRKPDGKTPRDLNRKPRQEKDGCRYSGKGKTAMRVGQTDR
jgi:hypothetical protein